MRKTDTDIPDMNFAAVEPFLCLQFDKSNNFFFMRFKIDPSPYKEQYDDAQEYGENTQTDFDGLIHMTSLNR